MRGNADLVVLHAAAVGPRPVRDPLPRRPVPGLLPVRADRRAQPHRDPRVAFHLARR